MKFSTRHTRSAGPSQSVRPGRGGSLAGSSGSGRTLASQDRPSADLADSVSAETEPVLATSWTAGSGLLAKAVRVGLWAALVCGPVAVGLAAVHPTALPAATAVSDSPDLTARRAASAEIGAEWVRTWLTTPASQADSVKALWAGQLNLPDRASSVANASVMQTVATAPGVWTVTVALDVTPPGGTAQRRYFRVPVGVAGGVGTASAHPLTLPAEISGPGDFSPPSTAYSVALAPTSAAGVTVDGFLAGLLAGSSDMTRWSSPGMAVDPVRPAPYQDLQISQLQSSADMPGLISGTPTDGASAQLLVTVDLRRAPPSPAKEGATAPVDTTTTITSQYLVTVTGRAGRWEVSALDSAPAMR